MQIKTVHKWQNALDTSMKVLKFVWRHLLVLGSFAITIQVICEGHIPSLKGEIICFTIAFSFDWLKMQFKATRSKGNLAQEQMFESARKNMDSSRFGSSAWATNPAMAGSPANHLYNLGYTNNYY